MAKLVLLVPLLALLAQAGAGCGWRPFSTSHRAWTSEDSWYTGPPSGDPPYWTWPELDRTRIHAVMASQESQAEALLQEVSVAELTDEQAVTFTGKALPAVPGTRAYLVRALVLNRAMGGWTVYVRDGRLLIYHRTLGRGPLPMTRQPLVLQLEEAPQQVYLAVSMAE